MPTLDLSQPLRAGDLSYPGDPPVRLSPHATHDADGYRVTHLSMGSHAGTHVDAPAHLLPDGMTLPDYDVETFSFDAVRVRLTDHGPRSPITRDDLVPVEEDADAVVLWTGWDRYWNEPAYFDHPHLTPDAASFLAAADLHVCVDAPNVDPTPTTNADPDESDGFPAHEALFDADRLIVENLTNLGRPPRRFTLDAYPLPLEDADGAPVRAVARWE